MLMPSGFLSEHMAIHILTMNLAVPLAVLLWRRVPGSSSTRPAAPWIATASAVQLVLLWTWHLPPALAYAVASPVAAAAMHMSLIGAALWFWHSVILAAERSSWRALAALLITGKLFCLLGVLLAFASRPLFSQAALAHAGHGAHSDPGMLLSDQQLAGLLMLIACPLSYVLAGIIIAARWMAEMERRPAWIAQEGTG